MRRRPILIALLAALLAVAVAASAAMAGPTGAPVSSPDGNSQSVGSVITPKKLYKKTFLPGALEVTTKLTTTASSGVPNPTVNVVIDFDKNAKLFTKGLPTCDPVKLQNQSTELAERACKSAKIGSGTAVALLQSGGGNFYTINQTVTAFNGVPKEGKPTVLLHSYGTTPIQTTLVLEGTVTNINREGYGPELNVNVPLIAGGSGALTEFNVKIQRTWKYKGNKVSFLSAKCPSSKKLKTRSVFTFRDGQTANPTYVQKCTPKPEPKK